MLLESGVRPGAGQKKDKSGSGILLLEVQNLVSIGESMVELNYQGKGGSIINKRIDMGVYMEYLQSLVQNKSIYMQAFEKLVGILAKMQQMCNSKIKMCQHLPFFVFLVGLK